MPLLKPSRELSLGEIISATFSLYGQRFLPFVLPFLIGTAISGVLDTVVFLAFLGWFGDISVLIVIVILVGLISLIIGAVATGTVVKYMADVLENRDTNLSMSFSFALEKLPSLIGAQILASIIIGIGFLLLIVPGIIFLIWFSLVIPVIVIEQKSAFESLGRSRRLVSNRWGKTFGLLLTFGIIIGLVGWIVGWIVNAFVLSLGVEQIYVLSVPIFPNLILTGLITSLISPISEVATTFLYYSMIARQVPPPPPPPLPPI
jgi:hypothetical protein